MQIRASIGELFADPGRDLGAILEDVARLSAGLVFRCGRSSRGTLAVRRRWCRFGPAIRVCSGDRFCASLAASAFAVVEVERLAGVYKDMEFGDRRARVPLPSGRWRHSANTGSSNRRLAGGPPRSRPGWTRPTPSPSGMPWRRGERSGPRRDRLGWVTMRRGSEENGER